MRIIRKIKRTGKTQADILRMVANSVEIFESGGNIYAHLLHFPGTWDIKQCLELNGKDSLYRGINLYKIEKYKLELSDLDEEDLEFLINELEYENARK